MNRFHDFDRGVSSLRNFVRRDAPDFCGVGARLWIADGTLPGKLVAFLPVFAAALSVALSGDHGAAGAFPPDVARGETKIYEREAVLYAF